MCVCHGVVYAIRLPSSVKTLQGPNDVIELLEFRRNSKKNKTSPSLFVAHTLYTRGYLAAPDHCRIVFFVQWTLVRRNTVNGTAPASSPTLV